MAVVGSTTTSSSILAALNSGNDVTSKGGANAEDIQNRFLTLLVAQLENQNPLNPMENAEITSQLAQMSTVQGIEQLNTTLSSLVNSFASTQAIQASALIGKSVLVPGSNLVLHEEEAFAGLNLSGSADQVTVSILDAAGRVVQTQDLGANSAGNLLFSWDGKDGSGTALPDGVYSFRVSATQGGRPVAVDPLQIGMVSALTRTTNGNFQLDLSSLGQFDFDDVQQVF